MDHRTAQRKLPLLLYDELSSTDASALRAHLAGCPRCRREHEELRRLSRVLSHVASPAITERSLHHARQETMRALRSTEPSVSFGSRVRVWLGLDERAAWRPALAFGAVAVLAFVAGSFVMQTPAEVPRNLLLAAFDPSASAPGPATDMREAQVTNLRVLGQDERSGAIEFEFEAVMPVRVRGNINDPAVQAVLARALVSSQNPGVRLRAANAIAGTVDDRAGLLTRRDPVKTSLIDAVLHDENRGVRLEALKALKSYLPDSAATAAILHVLRTEKNVGLKIAAINALDPEKFNRSATREQLVTALRERSVSDDNNYIRIRAAAALQEVQR